MRLVEAGQIALDQDVNDTLTSWKSPATDSITRSPCAGCSV
jgi:CubicO group peptidase (beta-lactamase class C family)